MIRRTLVVALCAAVLSASAIPVARACATRNDVIQRVQADVPDANFNYVDGAAADRLTEEIAQLTGSTLPAGGSYVLVDEPDAQLTYVVRFAEGCATHHGRFPRRLVQAWLNGQAAAE